MVEIQNFGLDQAANDQSQSNDNLGVAADEQDILDDFLLLLSSGSRSLKLFGDIGIGCDSVTIGIYHVQEFRVERYCQCYECLQCKGCDDLDRVSTRSCLCKASNGYVLLFLQCQGWPCQWEPCIAASRARVFNQIVFVGTL